MSLNFIEQNHMKVAITYGERRLDKSAATLWNSLPQNIRHVQSVFKKLLKTHLFRAAYGDSI